LVYATSAGEATDLDAAMQFAVNSLHGQREPGLDELRLTYMALKAGMDPQKLEGLAAAIVDPPLRGRAQLAILKARLAQTHGAAARGGARGRGEKGRGPRGPRRGGPGPAKAPAAKRPPPRRPRIGASLLTSSAPWGGGGG